MSEPKTRYPIVSFDLDGTIIRGTTVSRWLARYLGAEPAVIELEDQYSQRAISNRQLAEATAAMFAGVDVADVAEALSDIPIIEAVPETIAALKARGITVLLGTITWAFAAEILRQRFGFDAASGTEMGIDDGRLTGLVERHFGAGDKVDFVANHAAKRGFTLKDCAAVGDSHSDFPLFQAVGLGIALNATAAARAAADATLDKDSLDVVLPLLFHGMNGSGNR